MLTYSHGKRINQVVILFISLLCYFADAFAELHYPNISANQNAQQLFEKGMLNYFGYLYVQAEYDFRQALLYDPDCGMCYFGLALAKKQEALELGQPFALVGYDFIQKAKKLIATKEPFYQDLVMVAAQSFSNDPKATSKHLQVDYIHGLKKMWSKNKENVWRAENLAFYVDAVAYYANVESEDMGDIVLGHCGHMTNTEESQKMDYKNDALALMRTSFKNDAYFWTHPGIIHTYIHIAERDLTDPFGLKAAKLIPQFSEQMIAHYTHMPNHIFWRRGMYQAAIDANLATIKMDLHYFKSGGAGLNSYYYEYHYLHSHHFLTALGILTNNLNMSLKYAREIKSLMDVNRMAPLPDYRDTFLTLEHLVYARFGKWHDLLSLQTPYATGKLGFLFINFSRALAYLNVGNEMAYQKLFNEIKEEKFTDPTRNRIQTLTIAYLSAVYANLKNRTFAEIENIFRTNNVPQIEQDLFVMNPPIWFFPYTRFLSEVATSRSDLNKAKEYQMQYEKMYPKQSIDAGK